MIGTVLKGRYCIVEQIGEGGGGRVYLARDMELGIFRAVKAVSANKKKEVKLLRLLDHPAIPGIIDYIEEEDTCYLIMEYIRGESLGSMMRNGHRFSIMDILDLGEELAQVMEYLHNHRPAIYYGDLKPDNLMLSHSGRLYLVDVGSAVIDHGEKYRDCEGTRGYAAPEQYQGIVNEKSDIYAMGRTLRNLMRNSSIWRYVLYSEFFFFCFRCSRKDGNRRYRDMASVMKALKKLEVKYRNFSLRRLAAGGILILAVVGMIMTGSWLYEKQDFNQAVKEVTELYYQAKDRKSLAEREKSLIDAEKKLRYMLGIYGEKQEQQKLFILLAETAELKGDLSASALYYEQLLMYDSTYREVYGEYGMFLLRAGQEEASRQLWKDYRKKETDRELEPGTSRNLTLWKEAQNEKKR